MLQCVGLTYNNTTENPKFYILWGPHKNGTKSGKFKIWETILLGILAGNVQKVCKIAENSICRNVKSGFYYTRKAGITVHMNKNNSNHMPLVAK